MGTIAGLVPHGIRDWGVKQLSSDAEVTQSALNIARSLIANPGDASAVDGARMIAKQPAFKNLQYTHPQEYQAIVTAAAS